jgi:hypothetical protein
MTYLKSQAKRNDGWQAIGTSNLYIFCQVGSRFIPGVVLMSKFLIFSVALFEKLALLMEI